MAVPSAQFTPVGDCLLALLVGLFGGVLVGIALSRVSPLATDGSETSPSPPIPSIDGTGDASALEVPADETTLTDEETIVRLLASNGGRMRQSRIVEDTDWSKAKVSRLLSSMADQGAITKLTVGRENLIFLTVEARDHDQGSDTDRTG